MIIQNNNNINILKISSKYHKPTNSMKEPQKLLQQDVQLNLNQYWNFQIKDRESESSQSTKDGKN